jgi:enoyl-CoA hydratase
MSNPLLIEQKHSALIVRFNRPEIRSPLSTSVLEQLDKVLGEIESSDALMKIIFTGKDDVFASGADLREIVELNSVSARQFAQLGQGLMNRIGALRPVSVAAINGYCFGGALDLALACKRRIASPNATFSHPGAGLGIITGWGGTQRLPRLIGQARALEMFLTAGRFLAGEVLGWGLIDSIADDPVSAALNME